MSILWRIFLILVNLIVVPLCLLLIGLGIAIWWAPNDPLTKCVASGILLLAGIVFGFGTVILSIDTW